MDEILKKAFKQAATAIIDRAAALPIERLENDPQWVERIIAAKSDQEVAAILRELLQPSADMLDPAKVQKH